MCDNPNTVPHHEGLGMNMIGGKPPDTHAVPLCTICHAVYHNMGPMFWNGVDVKMEIIKLVTEYLKENNGQT